MPPHIDTSDPKYKAAAAEILRRHDLGEPEANITTAVRNFLTTTGLVKDEEIVEEDPPALGSRRAVDLTALDTFIEFKRRIGTTGGFNPDPENVRQLDDYLEASQKQGRVRMGVLTDGRYWLLRWPNAGPVKTVEPYAFTFDSPDRWVALHDWLRDYALSAEENKQPSRDSIAEHFGPNSPSYERDIATLKALYDEYAGYTTIKVKRDLWRNLLTAALGEIARTDDQLDGLFVRHTYLTAVIGMVVQARFGGDIVRLAANDPADLLHGRDFRNKTGLQGVVESDFFAWPTEVGGSPFLRILGRRIARFDWQQAPNDVAAILYETVIPPDERRQLGEYYTPDWLARAIVREVITDPARPERPRPRLRLGDLRRRGRDPLHRGRQGYLPRRQRPVGVAALLHCRHRRAPRCRTPGTCRLGLGRPARDSGRRRLRLRRKRHRSHLLGGRPPAPLPNRRHVRPT